MDSTTVAAVIPMIRTTTSSSMSVKPLECCLVRALLLGIPITDVGVRSFAARLIVGAEGVQIVFAAVRAGVHVLIVVPPGVLADALDVAARTPVADRRIRRLRRQRGQPLIGGRVARIVEAIHRERGL